MLLSGEQILKAKDKKTVQVSVPEWGEGAEVLVGSMGALDRAKLAEFFNERGTKIEQETVEEKPRIVTTTSPTEKGETLGEEEPEAETRRYTMTDHTEFKLMYLAASILDPKTYQTAFTVEQIKELGRKDAKPLNRLFDAAAELNLESVEALEGAEKNSG